MKNVYIVSASIAAALSLLTACGSWGEKLEVVRTSETASVFSSLELKKPSCKDDEDGQRFSIVGKTVEKTVVQLQKEDRDPSLREQEGEQVLKNTYEIPAGKEFTILGPKLYDDSYRFNLVTASPTPRLLATLNVKLAYCSTEE
ncbi:hypothetical protein GII36_02560 [Candidatus Mycosynbacter amalyticus]|uniref:Lipoprotein n=1 Tax=Candidatus Mycosynbacter amalyticus TaxID=2665156 RepID=A0A857MKR5_9BACT|nr:hypothetical protein [Candidatus Mycosynbacter amalyticus]QHN42728.1 hypothetical protein GII36_02560 [Candidatus Mycosynbacter amalyticus]